MTPLLPYLSLPEVPLTPSFNFGGTHVDSITIKPFGTLVATGVYLGWKLCVRQAKRLGLDAETMNSFFTWIVGGGFIGGHVFDVLLYHSDRLTEAKSILEAIEELVFVWRSQSSFGGFMGAVLGLIAWKYKFKVKDAFAYCDTAGSTFPIGWVFGRMGCTFAHDHPGMRSSAWFAVKYPGGARFDLGLYEMLFTIPLALTFLWLMRKPRPYGLYIGLMCTAYAPTRFAMDFLRAEDIHDADPRHLGLTPAQWLCTVLLAGGLYFLMRAMKAAERGETPHYLPEVTPADDLETPAGPSGGTPTETPSAG
jgi:phosphatidylglycerol:prolipoprotein diacylglycerol transferase